MPGLTLIRGLLMLVTLAGAASGVSFVAASADPHLGDASPLVERAPDRATPLRANADSLARAIATHDVFRASRLPSNVAFDPRSGDPGAAQPTPSVRPSLVVTGILAGAEPAAIIEGFPGIEGSRVLRAGERVGDFLIRSVAADQVVVAGRDTTWTLRVRSRFP